jgi:hypothetical protein
MVMDIPDHKFILIPNDFWYIETSEMVEKPYIEISKPNMVNISPIGYLISNPILLKFNFYQNKIVRIVANVRTINAKVEDFLYQITFSSFNFGVSE